MFVFYLCLPHIDIRHHFVREKVSDETVELNYCRSEDMVADILTKGLGNISFEKLRRMAGVDFTIK